MRRIAPLVAIVLALVALFLARPTFAGDAPPAPATDVVLPTLLPIPAAAAAVPLDPNAATRAYLDTVPPDERARSDAYFEGGYWLILWDFLLSSAIGVALLHFGVAAKMRDVARRVTGLRAIHVAVFWLMYLVVTSALAFPMEAYEGFFREHAYGLSTMTFGAWMGDELKGMLVGAIFGSILLMALYAVLARAKQTWWLWGSLVTIGVLVLAVVVAPVFVAPLFNHYEPVKSSLVRERVLSLARANGIPATEVWEFDASKQSNRVSANVSGLFGTDRISLNDNLLARCSIEEIEAVMAHEMGHYVLHHVLKGVVFFGLLVVVGFAFVRALFERLRKKHEARWKVEDVADPAGLPLLLVLFGAYAFLATPIVNSITRQQEIEADQFGINAARQPDGMAAVSLKLGAYRKLDPGSIEELLFFDHPSGRNRIFAAMRWKAEQKPAR